MSLPYSSIINNIPLSLSQCSMRQKSLVYSHTRSLPSSLPLHHSHPNPNTRKSPITLIPTGTPRDPTVRYGQDEHTASSQAERQAVSNQCSDSQRVLPFFSTFTFALLCFDSSILISVAMVGYDRQPEFEMNRPGAPTRYQRLAWTLLSKPMLREACEKEGLRVDWALVKRIATEGDGDSGNGDRLPGKRLKRWRRGVRSKL